MAAVVAVTLVSCGAAPASLPLPPTGEFNPGPVMAVPSPVPTVQPVIPHARPVRLSIPSLGLSPQIEVVGLDHGHMATPQNVWNVGWYKAGPVPGAPGDAVIDGHAGYPNNPLVFGRLAQIRLGAQIVVQLADKSREIFKVTYVKAWDASTMPPGTFATGGAPRLTLITCNGVFNGNSLSYDKRLYVIASLVGVV